MLLIAKPKRIRLVWLMTAANVGIIIFAIALFVLSLQKQMARQMSYWGQRQMLLNATSALEGSSKAFPLRTSLKLNSDLSPEEIVAALFDNNQSSRILSLDGKVLASRRFASTSHFAPPHRTLRLKIPYVDVEHYHRAQPPCPTPEQITQALELAGSADPTPGRRRRGNVSWISSHNGREFLNVLIELKTPGRSSYLLQMYSSWRTNRGVLSNMNRLFWLFGALSALVCALLSILASKYLTRHLEHLAQTANRVANGDLSARTNLQCNQAEINDVASAFDHMVGRLEKSFDAQKRFVADASHELKTPLTAVSGMAELLEDATPEESVKALSVMNKEIKRMSSLINDLLLLSRTELKSQTSENLSPTAPGELATIDLIPLVKDAFDCATSTDTTHTFRLDLAPKLLYSPGFSSPAESALAGSNAGSNAADKLSRVFRNIIENARKYSPDCSEIYISCHSIAAKDLKQLEGADEEKLAHLSRNHQRLALFVVRDHGAGIPPQDLPHVYERFYRADLSRNRKTGGSGLGLSIVLALVESAAGATWLRNHPQGGLEVFVLLPLRNQD